MRVMPDPGARLEHDAMHSAARDEDVRAALAALRQRGERVTAPRRAVLTVLAGRADHLTADDVSALLEGSDVHRATVYRTLDLLAASGVVSRQHSQGGATRFHLATVGESRKHLHGHCTDCGAVVVLPVGAFRTAARMLRASTGFAMSLPQSTLIGRCAACLAAAAAPTSSR